MDSVKALLGEALAALQANQPQKALDILEKVGKDSADDPNVSCYRGIALAKLGRSSEATDCLENAVKLGPTVGRFRFTLAAHYRDLGQKDDAIRVAREGWRLDPKFPGFSELFSSLGLDLSAEPKETLREKLRRAAAEPKGGRSSRSAHAFPVIEQFADKWTQIGWVLVVLTFVGPILVKLHLPMHEPSAGEQQGLVVFGKWIFNTDPLSRLTIFTFIVAGLLSGAWTLVDVLDRRARIQWLIPMVPFSCFCGLPGIGQAIYMSLGRK